MVDTPKLGPKAQNRIEQERRVAEANLKKSLATHRATNDYRQYIPAFVGFTLKILEAELREHKAVGTFDEAMSLIHRRASEIIEDILPEKSIETMRSSRWFSGVVTLAENGFQHGDWESFAPEAVRVALRNPQAAETVRWRIHAAILPKMTRWATRISSAVVQPPPAAVSSEAEYPIQSKQLTAANRADIQASGAEVTDRRKLIDLAIRRFNQETSFRLNRTLIWKAAGHKTGRQFQYWQKNQDCPSRASRSAPRGATRQDDENFSRILTTEPNELVTLLKRKKLI